MYAPRMVTVSPERLAGLIGAISAIDLTPGPGGSRGSDVRTTTCVYGPLMAWLFPESKQIMLMALEPSSQIVGHADAPIRARRFHIPLQTNPDCWVYHAGIWQQLTVGEVYEMDPAIVHGAVNWGTTRRVHLVVDV